MLRNLATSLFDKERIMTTLPKAKALRPFAEKIITLARQNDLAARRLTAAQIHDDAVVKKLFDDIAKRYKDDKKGGYTRIVAHRSRWGDGAMLAFIELNKGIFPDKEKDEAADKKKKKAAKAKSEKPE